MCDLDIGDGRASQVVGKSSNGREILEGIAPSIRKHQLPDLAIGRSRDPTFLVEVGSMSTSQVNRDLRMFVARIGDDPEQWNWTIVGPNGVKMVETGFTSCRAALSAGRLALEKLLGRGSGEANRT